MRMREYLQRRELQKIARARVLTRERWARFDAAQRLAGQRQLALATLATPVVPTTRKVNLRAEHSGLDHRYLDASVSSSGDLRISGQDIGPFTEMWSFSGDFEWFHDVQARNIERLVALLGGRPGQNVLDLLENKYTGDGSYDLVAVLRSGDVPVRHSYR